MPDGTLKEIEIQGVGRFQVPDDWDDARIKQHILRLQVTKPEIFFGQPSTESLQETFRAQRGPVEQAAELPGAAKMGGIEAVPKRSMFQTVMDMIRRGTVGEVLAGTEIGRLTGLESDVSAAGRDPNAALLRLTELSPKETLKAPSLRFTPGMGAVPLPGQRQDTREVELPEITGVIRGGLEFGEEMLRPTLIMMLGTLGMTAKAAPVLGRFISGGFSVHMMKSLFDQYPELKEAAESDDPSEFWRVGTQMGLTGLMVFMTGKHAVKGRAAPAELPYVTRLKELGYEDFQVKQMAPSQAVDAIVMSKGPGDLTGLEGQVSPILSIGKRRSLGEPLKPEVPADVMERARLEEEAMAPAPEGGVSFADIPEAGVRTGEPMMVRQGKLKPLSRKETAALEAQYLENIPEEAQRGYEAGEMDKMFLGQPEAPAEPRLVMAPTDVTRFFEPPTPTSRQLPVQAGPSREIPGRLPGAAQAKEAIRLPEESKTYEGAQQEIDTLESLLMSQGIDITKLADVAAIESAKRVGVEPGQRMPVELEALYKKREGIGARELSESLTDLQGRLTKSGIRGEDAEAVLDYYSLRPGKVGATEQYFAAEYTERFARKPINEQLEGVAIRLAAKRGETFDDIQDISAKTRKDAALAVREVVGYFRGAEPTRMPKPQPISPLEAKELGVAPERVPEVLRRQMAAGTARQKAAERAPVKPSLIMKGITKKELIKRERVSPKTILTEHKKSGGSTFSLKRGNLAGKDLYSVGLYPKRSVVLDRPLTEADLTKFMSDNADLLRDPKNSIGTWTDKKTGKTYLDVAYTTPSLKKAMEIGLKNKEKAIYDLQERAEIPLPVPEPFEGLHVSRKPVAEGILRGARRGEEGVGAEKLSVRRGEREPGVYLYRKGVAPEKLVEAGRPVRTTYKGKESLADVDTNPIALRARKRAIAEGKDIGAATEKALREAGYTGLFSSKRGKESVLLFGDRPVTPAVKPPLRKLIERPGEARPLSLGAAARKRKGEAGKIIGEALINPLKPLLELYTKKIGTPIVNFAKALASRVSPEFLKRAMLVRYGQPEAFKLADLMRIIETTKAGFKATELGARLTKKLSQVEQKSLGRFIRGELTEADLRRVRTDPRFEDAVEAAKEARQAFDELGGQAVTQGLLSDKTFFENYGRYMPRLYRKYEVDHGSLLSKYGLKKPTRLDLARFKMRKDIPEEIRVLMGEILEPGYPVAKGITQITADIEKMKLFKTVAKNPDWVSDQPIEGFSKLPLPDAAKLGPLRGKYVQKYIYEELERIVRIPSDAERIGRSLVGEWKASKVLLNPATHGRNLMSNTILAWLGGLSPTRVDIYHKALMQLRRGGKDFTDARNAGLFRSTFTEAELNEFTDTWTQSTGSLFDRFGSMADLLDGLKVEKAERLALLKRGKPLTAIAPRLKAKAARLYELEEQWFKLAKFIHNRERGMNVKEATLDAEHWLFNYQEVPRFIDWARRSPLSPTSWFITFTYKALPVIAESAIKYPWRLGSIMLMLEGIQKVSEKVLGVDEEEKRRIDFAMPERMKAKPAWLRRFLMLFVKDKYDQYIYWDLTYTLPWGDLGEVGGEGTWAHPLLFAPTWRLAAELILNKSAYTGRELWSDTDLPSEKVRRWLLHFYRAIAPSLAPGGWSETKLRRALKGELDYWGRETSLTSAIASSLLGFKTVSLNVNKEIFFKIKDFQAKVEELKKRAYSISNNKGMSEEKKLREFQKLRLVYEQLVKRYSNKEKK